MNLRTTLHPIPGAPRAARQALDVALEGMDPELRSRVMIAVSELVTNAVRHGGLAGDDALVVVADDGSGPLRITVEQPTAARAAIQRSPGVKAGGWGLRIVDVLADRWGVIAEPPGAVWFEVDVGGSPR